MNKKIALIIVATSILLTGCGREKFVHVAGSSIEDNQQLHDSVNQSEEVLSSNDSESAIDDKLIVGDKIVNKGGVTYSYKDTLPIIVNGKVLAYATINQLERVGIYDWYNNKAIKKNIKHSYSLNLNIENKVDKVLTVGVTPTLINDSNTNVSSYCKVGWTGFGESAEFYGKGKIPIEVGFQPEIKKETGLRLKLVFQTSEGESDPVIISNNIFKHVVQGPSLKNKSDTTMIKSISGAKYSFNIDKVYKEQNMINLNEVDVIEFDNKIKYIKKPDKGKQVSTFDPKNKYTMYASLRIGMQTQHNPDLNYTHNFNAIRKDYFETYTDYYASAVDKILKKGNSVRYHLNRVLTDENSKDKFVRFVVEFPEEAEAASVQELLKFNGRFTVYQCNAQKRKIVYEQD